MMGRIGREIESDGKQRGGITSSPEMKRTIWDVITEWGNMERGIAIADSVKKPKPVTFFFFF